MRQTSDVRETDRRQTASLLYAPPIRQALQLSFRFSDCALFSLPAVLCSRPWPCLPLKFICH